MTAPKVLCVSLFSFLISFSFSLQAQVDSNNNITKLSTSDTSSEEIFELHETYYKIRTTNDNLKNFSSPLELSVDWLKSQTRKLLSLLDWMEKAKTPADPDTIERYNRRKHFGGWIKDPSNKTCYNVRALVLIRDAQSEVYYKDSNPCLVDQSEWLDPYSGDVYYDAQNDVQIDHFVPLKHAYLAGAWKWESEFRCNYANFMGNDFHLLAVSSYENKAKSDSSPENYMPSNTAYACEYLENWLKVKAIWDLAMTRSEVSTVNQFINDYQCNLNEFVISEKELRKQQTLAASPSEACQRFGQN